MADQLKSNPSLQDFMPHAKADEGNQFNYGTLSTEKRTIDEETIITAMRTVHDPEIPINIYDLGLIYNIAQDECANIIISMTLTAPACPVAGILPAQVAEAVGKISNIGKVTVTLTWEPSWNKEMMSEDAKLVFDF